MSTTTVPETVTLTLTSDDVSHANSSLGRIIEMQEEQGDGQHPANLMARGIISKLPENGGEVELSLVEAFRLEKGVNIADADFNAFALMLGAYELSPTAESLRSQLDSALGDHDPEAVDAVAQQQGEQAFAELEQLATAPEAA